MQTHRLVLEILVHIDPLKSELAGLASGSRRARLRLLMPTIAELVASGVARQDIVDQLVARDLPITLAGLKSALRRWRKRQAQPTSHSPGQRTPPDTTAPSQHCAQASPASVSNKGDLVRLRRASAPDLAELARIAKQEGN
ncbi:Uncharacterised protein [Bordetella ansorpii]|uniref:Uncharacterized protein n=1 Tax=Bordetella ansorpii TaxID=288768 RepID=A0A157SRY9_9BORD|nr:hypothetical protein [Bordetella ansorpii]SAI73155.1 Uncharacterised protein [Bordetella ansorpii]